MVFKESLAESAQYALLRRIAPMLSHNLAGVLQPLSMMSSILEKRLQNPQPDYAALTSKSSQLKTLAREASSACMNLMTWFMPDNSEQVTVAEGVDDAIGMVITELSFKGFTLANQIGDIQAQIPRNLTRHVFIAALMALTDAATVRATVVLQAHLVDNELVLTILLESSQGELVAEGLASYRKIQWADVQALAEVQSVRLTCAADSVKLHCPLY